MYLSLKSRSQYNKNTVAHLSFCVSRISIVAELFARQSSPKNVFGKFPQPAEKPAL